MTGVMGTSVFCFSLFALVCSAKGIICLCWLPFVFIDVVCQSLTCASTQSQTSQLLTEVKRTLQIIWSLNLKTEFSTTDIKAQPLMLRNKLFSWTHFTSNKHQRDDPSPQCSRWTDGERWWRPSGCSRRCRTHRAAWERSTGGPRSTASAPALPPWSSAPHRAAAVTPANPHKHHRRAASSQTSTHAPREEPSERSQIMSFTGASVSGRNLLIHAILQSEDSPALTIQCERRRTARAEKHTQTLAAVASH